MISDSIISFDETENGGFIDLENSSKVINELLHYIIFINDENNKRNLEEIKILDIIMDFGRKFNIDIETLGGIISTDEQLKNLISLESSICLENDDYDDMW